MWLAESGRISGTFATFKVEDPRTAKSSFSVEDLMHAWDQFMEKRNLLFARDNAQAWVASPLFAESQTEQIVKNSFYLCMGTLMAMTCFMTLVLTCSLGITVAILVSMLLCLCTFATFWIGVGNRDIDSMVIVSLSVFLSGLVTPLLRVANAYAYARDRPHLPADMMLLEVDSVDTEVARSKYHRKLIDAAALEDLAKQHAEEMGEGEILMFPGAINMERQNRVATAMQRGGAPALGLGGAAVIGGLALLPLEMEALGQVGLSILCMGFAVPPAVGLLGVLLLLGLGDSKARRKAFRELGSYTWSRLSGHVVEARGLLDGRSKDDKGQGNIRSSRRLSHPNDPDIALAAAAASSREPPFTPQHKPHTVAAMMLGAPLGVATGVLSPFRKKNAQPKKGQPQAGQAIDVSGEAKQSSDDVGSEAGPCILTLDVQGATAKPPYHIVMATRDVINVKG